MWAHILSKEFVADLFLCVLTHSTTCSLFSLLATSLFISTPLFSSVLLCQTKKNLLFCLYEYTERNLLPWSIESTSSCNTCVYYICVVYVSCFHSLIRAVEPSCSICKKKTRECGKMKVTNYRWVSVSNWHDIIFFIFHFIYFVNICHVPSSPSSSSCHYSDYHIFFLGDDYFRLWIYKHKRVNAKQKKK